MSTRSKPTDRFTCPMCLEVGGRKTREHLPLKALYKGSSDIEQDNPAIIRVCQRCNNEKSIWDQEILAQYGHLMDIDRAEKAQQSIQNPSALSSSLQAAVAISRMGPQDGKMEDIRYRGSPADTISQWMSYCARGIYMFFERTPFRGIGISSRRSVIDHNINADRFKFSSERHHRINASCSLELYERSEDLPKAAMVYLRSSENRLFSFMTVLFEDEKQWSEYSQSKPDIVDPRPLRIANPRDIFEITKSSAGYSYKGVKKLKRQ